MAKKLEIMAAGERKRRLAAAYRRNQSAKANGRRHRRKLMQCQLRRKQAAIESESWR
jgi:hypothetical protein